jgi:hypothetical protein
MAETRLAAERKHEDEIVDSSEQLRDPQARRWQEELDERIEDQLRLVQDLRSSVSESLLRVKLTTKS